VISQDIDKDTYFLTKEICNRHLDGFIGKVQFLSLHAAVGKRQEYFRRLSAEKEAKENAAGEVLEEKRSEEKAEQDACDKAKQERLAEIKGRSAVCIRFRGRSAIVPVLPVNDLTEAQMVSADYGKPIFVQLGGEIKKVSKNKKSGKFKAELAYNYDILKPAEVRAARRGNGGQASVKPKAKVVAMKEPRICPIWITGKKGVIKAACIVNPIINMSTLDYVNAVSRFLHEYDWAALENGKDFFLFERSMNGFVACGTARKATGEEKKTAKSAAKEAVKAAKQKMK